MAVQGLMAHSIVQGVVSKATSGRRVWAWGGVGVVALGYSLTHLPDLFTLLEWSVLSGGLVWGIRKFSQRSADGRGQLPVHLTLDGLQRAIAQAKTLQSELVTEWVNHWGSDVPDYPVPSYEARFAQIEHSLMRSDLEVQIVGTRAVGKTTLCQLLRSTVLPQGEQRWLLPPLAECSMEMVLNPSADWPEPLRKADVVVFVVQGDLTQQEWMALERLRSQPKRVLLVLNKQDQYLPVQAELVLEQLKQRVKSIVDAEDIVAIAANPQPIKIRRHQDDGVFRDTWETPPPQLQPLLARIQIVATQESSQLILQGAYQQVLAVQQDMHDQLNQVRRDRAMPILEKYQWIAAGIAFSNPLPSLDLVATAAITGKMIQDLADIYGIRLSLDRATEMAGVLAKAFIQMGLVEASSQVLSVVLKGHAFTYVAGGVIQGVGAAYFTRMAGLSLMELFAVPHQNSGPWQLDGDALSQTVQRIFKQHQRVEILTDLAQKTLAYLQPQDRRVVSTP